MSGLGRKQTVTDATAGVCRSRKRQQRAKPPTGSRASWWRGCPKRGRSATGPRCCGRHINTVLKVEARYLPMVLQALGRPEMRGRRLDCYEVLVMRWEGVWRVGFLGHRDPLPPDEVTDKGTIVYLGNGPPNPNCPDLTFEFDETGRITRALRSRH
jgi:hypothetical protein